MTEFVFSGPDGKEHVIEAPEGSTPQQAFAVLQKAWGAQEVGASQSPAMPWGEVGRQALENAPASAWNLAKGAAQPFMHPIETAEALGNVGRGAIAMGGSALAAAVPSETLPEKTFGERYQHGLNVVKEKSGASEAYPEAVGKYFMDRYGSVEGFKKAVAADPAGVLADLSIPLTAGGGVAARAPGIAGKIGEAARAAGDIANPFMGPAKAAGATAEEAQRLTREIKAPTTEALYEAADAAYKKPALKELDLKPGAVQQWKDELSLALNNDWINDALAPKTFATLARIDNAPKGAAFSGQSFESLRRTLGKIAKNPDATEAGAATRAINSLDNFLENLPANAALRGDPATVSAVLKEARGNYAAAKRSDVIDTAIEKAQRQAGRANSGMNLDNATRQRISSILNSTRLSRGFSADELKQMDQIVKGSTPENVTRRVANILGGGGGLGTVVAGGIGSLLGGPAAAVLTPAVGFALKTLSGAMSQADVRKLQELVRTRSPLGQQMQSSLGKFGKASTAVKGSPTSKNIARFMLASRNLSSNLADAGITVPPEDIAGGVASADDSGK
jgi:hypothetical protein